MKITLVGMGSGAPGSLTAAGLEALRGAELIIGARRLLENLPEGCTANRAALYKTDEICAVLRQTDCAEAAVVFSGDTGFYSGAAALCRALDDAGLPYTVLPGVSSVQLLAAALGRPWQGWRLVSAHGCACDPVAACRAGGTTFFLTGGSDTHDVLDSTANRCSGEIRNFVKMDTDVESIENELPVQLMNGHGYVSSGPLMFPSDDAMFGDTFSIGEQGSMDYTLPVQAVNGLDKIEVYSQDGLVDTYTFEGTPETGTYTITLQPTEKSWYQFVVTDTLGLHAYSNPIFLEP